MRRVNTAPGDQALRAAYEIHTGLYNPGSPDFYSYQSFSDLVAGKGGALFTLENTDKQVVAYLLFRTISDEAEVLSIAVQKDHQKQGFGRVLLKSLIHHLKSQGFQALFLEVAADNRFARKLYTNLGAKTVGNRQNYYKNADGKPVVALVKKINLR